jgi:hypothetical protein
VTEPLQPPSTTLDDLVKQALTMCRSARRHRKSLSGDNFYGNKLAKLRADATNAFAELSDTSVGDITASAELIEAVFSATTVANERIQAARELQHALRTKWKHSKAQKSSPGNELFPLSLIAQAQRGYLVTIAAQMNGCFREGWYDACAVMMRRIVEIVLIEAFEHQGIAAKAKDNRGEYLQLTALIDQALAEPNFKLSRNAKAELPKLRDIGHRSAHGRYFTAQRSDITKIEGGVRVVVEEFLNHAGLI